MTFKPRVTYLLHFTSLFMLTSALAQEIKIPAFTAYSTPDFQAVRFNKDGASNWSTHDAILWGGVLSVGEAKASVSIKLSANEKVTLSLKIGKTSKEIAVIGTDEFIAADFGVFVIDKPGYQTIELSGVSKTGKTYGDLQELILSGTAAKDAFFNLKPRKNSPSVHLVYPFPKDTKASWFYCEATAKLDPVYTYYEVCGFARGYFGMQVNSSRERRIIFSIWDAGGEGVDRKKVADENRVKLLAKGDGVVAGDFGNEGTGGHSHLVYNWKTNDRQRFLVSTKIDGDATIYTGYYFNPDNEKWKLIASFRAPHDGKTLHGLYSFSENFGGSNGHLRRLVEYGNQWIKTTDDKWIELTTAKFTHDSTGGKDRRDFGAGLAADGNFYLSNGGFVADAIKYGDAFTRKPTGKPPEIKLP